MSKKSAIELKGVSKKYILHHEKPTLVENILWRKKPTEFWALKNISLRVRKGEKIGIVGDNGSGKTTLLEIIAQITKQTSGRVKTAGRVVSLIELDAGFHPDLTGEENIYLNAMLLGTPRKEINDYFSDIVDFADIGQFLDAPLYTYSEGMKLRLGFAVAAYTNPDILLLDENLEVGDQEFQKKAIRKIKEFLSAGKTVIIVSHNLEFIESNCERVIWMENGEIKMDDKARRVIESYKKRKTVSNNLSFARLN